jgi:CBS domain-containing protein
VSKEELADYFAFVKEVHSRVAAMRTDATGKLVGVVTVNDLSGANLFGSSAFRDALSLASKTAAPLYPGLAGPTVLLNLPPILNALVKLFKPLFPPVVAARYVSPAAARSLPHTRLRHGSRLAHSRAYSMYYCLSLLRIKFEQGPLSKVSTACLGFIEVLKSESDPCAALCSSI